MGNLELHPRNKNHLHHSEWNSYRAAKYRCTNSNASDFKYYGGRGIEFRFGSFAHFLSVLGEKPSPDYTLEREDVSGHYEAGNVRWATRKEQMNNTRRNRYITAFGRTQTFTQWSDETGIGLRSLNFRISRNWCEKCTFDSKAKTCTHGYDRNNAFIISARNRSNNRLIKIGEKNGYNCGMGGNIRHKIQHHLSTDWCL